MRAAGVAVALPVVGALSMPAGAAVRTGDAPLEYRGAVPGPTGFYTDETPTPVEDVAAYCNFYEFGTDKGDPARYAREMTVDPWSVEVDGAVHKPGKLHLEDVLSGFDLEERIYRLRGGLVHGGALGGFPPWRTCSSASNPKVAPASRPSKRFTGARRCGARVPSPAPSTGPIARDCALMRPCTR